MTTVIEAKREPDRLRSDSGMGASTVRILRTAEEIESVREFWSSCPGTLASDSDIFLPLHASPAESLRPYVLVLYREGEPVALLPARLARMRFELRLGYFTLFRPLVNILGVPTGGLRGYGSSENCQELVRAIIACLKSGEADLAVIPGVTADSPLYRWIKSQPGFLFRDHFAPLHLHRKRALPNSVDRLYSDLSHHERKRFRQLAKKLSNDFCGQVRVDRFDSSVDLDRALPAVEEIAEKTWQRRFGRGFRVDAYLLQILKTQAERGWLRIHVLYVENKPCAFSIGAVYQGTFYSNYIGYDPAYATYQPGTHLLSRLMEELCREGIAEIDFLGSDEEYKRRWGNLVAQEANLRVFAPSWKGLRLSAMNAITNVLSEVSARFINRTGLTQRMKGGWRAMRVRRAGANGKEPEQAARRGNALKPEGASGARWQGD